MCCPINFGDCPDCEHFSEGTCQYEEKQCSICQREISYDEWDNFGGMCARCENHSCDVMIEANEEEC